MFRENENDDDDNDEPQSPITINRVVVEQLREQLETSRATEQAASTQQPLLRQLKQKQQEAIIMRVFTKINNQILKLNVKKLFQIWSIYHPENVNCQIISQRLFKGASADLASIRQELLLKNQKTRKNNGMAKRALQKGPAGFNAALLGGEYCCLNNSYATMTVLDGSTAAAASTAAVRSSTKRQRKDAFKIPPSANLQLFRSLDKRGLLNCARMFDASTYHITDLPLIMCYTEYHIDKLLEVCRRSRSFPVHLLPVFLREDAIRLLRM